MTGLQERRRGATARIGASLPSPVLGAIYIALYALLDWLSFIEPFAPFGITPWSPSTGLSFILVLLFGRRFIPLLFLTPLLTDLFIRHLPLPLALEIATSALIGGGYGAALLLLLHPALRFDPALTTFRNLVLLMAVAVASAALVAASYVGAIIGAGSLPAADFPAAALRYWVGDVIGIAVLAPFALIWLTRRKLPKPSLELALQIATIVGALVIVFVYGEEYRFQLFYVLFLPIVWMATRAGLEGVTLGILITQLGLIWGVQLLPTEDVDVTAFQALMLVAALTGLVAGSLVTERRRTEAQLRRHQESLARSARIGSMGEVAAALAHEINQPLTAAGTYARLVTEALEAGHRDDAHLAETARKAAAQVERAAEVVRRLRALIRLDRGGRVAVDIGAIARRALRICQPELDRAGVTGRVAVAPAVPPVVADALQIEQVLINLVRNAAEAIAGTGRSRGTVAIEVLGAEDAQVEIRVRDSGPGFPPELLNSPFLPFLSTKSEGLGVGLALCRSIIESHGGRLWLGGDSEGAVVHFTLPTDRAPE